MKKTYLIAAIALFSGISATLSAQTSSLTTAILAFNKGELAEAKKYIDPCIGHEKTMGLAKTWVKRGEIYNAIYSNQKELDDMAVAKAFASFTKAQELDAAAKKPKYKDEIRKGLDVVRINSFNLGITSFNEGKHKEAFQSFQNSISASKNLGMVDSLATFNAALAAENGEMLDDAIVFYKQSAEINYGGSSPYVSMARVYEKQEKIDLYIQTLKDGVAKFPKDQTMIIALINYYLNADKKDEAHAYLSKAIELDPKNAILWSNRGTVNDSRGEKDLAITDYKKAIELDPKLFDAPFNLGVLYYNGAAEEQTIVNEIKDDNEYNKGKARVDEMFKVALPYLEMAYGINPDDSSVKQSLTQLYARLKMTDKYNAIKGK